MIDDQEIEKGIDRNSMEFQVIYHRADIRRAHKYEIVRDAVRWLFDNLPESSARLEIQAIRGMQPEMVQKWIDEAVKEVGNAKGR